MGAKPRFVADAMLGSLARKLRIFGFDTVYFKEGEDSELEEVARKGSRIILTSDKGLSKDASRKGIPVLLLEGKTDRARLRAIALAYHLALSRDDSRCAVCNGELERIGKAEARDARLPEGVVARHRIFYRCRSCSNLYWRGRHWVRLRRLSSAVRRKDIT